MDKFYLVSASLLPEAAAKVIEAQNLMQTGQVKRIGEAVREVGISRGTYYKYKNSVFPYEPAGNQRKAIISMAVQDVKGVLSIILTRIARLNCNVIAINQTIPISHVVSVTLTLDVSDLEQDIEDLVSLLAKTDRVLNAQLVSVG